jgi:hypothetical protein
MWPMTEDRILLLSVDIDEGRMVIARNNRIRRATDGYARLVEAAVRLHARELAQQLGMDGDGPLPQDFGDRLGDLLVSAPPVARSNGDESA